MDFETRAIHVGQEPDPATGSVTTPIYQTSTFAQEAVGVNKGYDYARVANPTRTALEECLASLEGADFGHAFSSGLGAATTVMHLVDPGERVVCVNDVYGGIYRMFSQVYEPKGYDFTYLTADAVSTDLADHLDARTRLVWVESPTNPLLNIVDLRAAADAAHAAGALLVVDNTFATPYLQQPLGLGADIVLHSTTKYLGGHSDVIGGFAATNDPTISRAAALPPEVARRRARAARRVARPARPEDAGAAHDQALRERASRRRIPPGARTGRRRCSTRDCPTTPATPSLPARCAISAAWSRSCSSRRTRPSRWSRAPRSGRSRRASAASRA